jgi:arabinofuranan 3-O-arabinosyltransferase
VTATLETDMVDPDLPSTVQPVAGPCADPLSRWVLAGLGVFFLVVTFAQMPGSIVFDTKLPVVMAPGAWMHSALHFWNLSATSGSVQNETFGYLFPMAPFFALTHLAHVPIWCAERLWLALLLTTGAWGTVRLAEALGIGKRWTRVLGAMAYCVTPIIVDWAAISISLLAVVLLPWVLHPLVVGSREGSPRRAAAKSGVAVALLGGVNATVIISTLPLAILWMFTRAPGPRRRSLMGWWVVSVVLACFWWFGATVLQGKYGYNYLPYTETGKTTTAAGSLFSTLRGTTNWQNYYTMTSRVAILAAAVMTALGLAGLAKRIPERLFLVASLSFGVLVITIGYGGVLGGPFSHLVITQLSGSLAPLRSVAKFSPCVALPLALGLMAMVSSPSIEGVTGRWARRLQGHRARGSTGLIAAIAVVLAALPFWQQQLYPFAGFSTIPGYWSQTASWLDGHQGDQTALLVPGSAFADYTWGRPRDEPLSVLTSTSTTVKSVLDYGSDGNTDMLSTVEYAIDSGTSQPGLARYLSRSGIDFVVERNDLNLKLTGAPPPAQIHQVLSETPGLVQVASFGPYQPLTQVAPGDLQVYNSRSSLHLRAVEIYRVIPPVAEVQTFPATDPVIVSGSASSLLALSGTSVTAHRATVLAKDPAAKKATKRSGATWAITDGNQRRGVFFGVIQDNLSYLLGPGQTDGRQPTQRLMRGILSRPDAQTVFAPSGAASVSATSYGSTLYRLEPAAGPASAFDGDPTTAWIASNAVNSVGQAVTLSVFDKAVRLNSIFITPLDDSPHRPTIKKVTIYWDTGSVTRYLPVTNKPVRVSVTPELTRDLQIVIDAVRPPSEPVKPPLGAGITDITVPGLDFRPAMALPTDKLAAFSQPTRNLPVVSLYDPVTNPNLDFSGPVTEPPPMDRRFVLPRSMSASVTGVAVPNPGAQLEGLLAQVAEPSHQPLQVSASSWLRSLPRFRPPNLLQGTTSPWIAGQDDRDPSLTLRWSGVRSIGSIVLRTTPQASRPTRLVISSPGGTRSVPVPPAGGTVSFAPLATDTLSVHFAAVAVRMSPVPNVGISLGLPIPAPVPLPVGLQSIGVPALGIQAGSAPDRSTPVALPCGSGPTVGLDGTALPTQVTGHLADLVDLRPMAFGACSTDGTLFSQGNHTLSFPHGSAFRVTNLLVETSNPPATPSSGSAARSAHIRSWSPATRTLDVTAGPATYVQVAQNFNSGWRATLGKQTLKPISLDGWQQGWVVPAGVAGTITMTFAPDRQYRIILLIGLVLLVALFVLAFGPRGRANSGPVGPRRKLPGWLLAGVSVIVLFSASGWLAMVVVPLFLMARRWGSGAMAAMGGGAFLIAGVVAAAQLNVTPSVSQGAFGGPAQIFSAVALAAVFVGLSVDERRRQTVDSSEDDGETIG